MSALSYLPYLCAAIIAILLLVGVIIILTCRRYVANTFNAIDQVLDRILTRNYDVRLTTADHRLSKLAHKTNRIIDLCVSDIKQAQAEKETLQSFISDMSHQMKTPLASICMYSDLLVEGNLDAAEQQEFLIRMKSGTEKLQWMMDSLIKMSRLEIGAIQLTPTPTGIRQTISESISGVVALAARKNINIVTTALSDIELYHDRKWTREALNNILENAVKYSPTNSTIAVTMEQLPLYTKIIITDQGIGIDESDYNLLFKRFYRGQNVADQEGAGLGLYLARLIMEKQGGYIMVDSNLSEYTSFALFLQNCKKPG